MAITPHRQPLKVAILSLHTSPLTQPGTGDSGGMNVYIRELVSHLAHTGAKCSVYVRAWHPDLAEVVKAEPGVEVIHIRAGDYDLAKEQLGAIVEEFTDKVEADILRRGGVDVIHANYWLSAVAGHKLKHRLELPLVTTFHTLARVKAEMGEIESEERIQAESQVIKCSDVVTASCVAERNWLMRLYGTPAEQISYIVPGVDTAFFSPGNQQAAREAVGIDDRPTALFVGRIQPHKGVVVAAEAFGRMRHKDAQLVIIGGPSGSEGQAELERVYEAIDRHNLADRVIMTDPVPHHLLSSWYRAANVLLVPSRSESFGLVALEAAACATPVIAASVGGLRTLVHHGKTGFLVEGRDPSVYATYLDQIFQSPTLGCELAFGAVDHSKKYRWRETAQSLRELYHKAVENPKLAGLEACS